MPYLVLDLETTGTKTFGRFCNPLDPRHYITAVAYKYQGEQAKVIYLEKQLTAEEAIESLDLSKVTHIVGQNLKFDLLYLWKSDKLQQWINDGGRVWDTQTVEYLLTGQDTGKRNLDFLSTKYGAELKDHKVTDMFEAGLLSKDIPKDMLIEYAKNDVINTNTVFKQQFIIARQETPQIGRAHV